jgi:5-methyltetrahydropteroyltriglutamate--homocysteine methyltransferase
MRQSSAPFHADHVGSLLRPPELHAARDKAQRGEISAAEMRSIEDRCIREVVALQEGVGLKAVTDGEMRRAFWHVDFLTGFDGIVATKSNYAVKFKDAKGEVSNTGSMLVVDDKICRRKPVMLDDFNYLKSVATATPKICMPAPTYLHMRGGRKVVSATAYPDIEEFWADIIRAYREEIADLAAAGCTYIQLDDVSISYLCDQSIRAQIDRDGEDVGKLPAKYAAVLNAIVGDRPQSLAVTLHTCRGNFQSMWMAEGGYEAVAETVFSGVKVDGFFLEYDDARSGGFEPLRFVPKGTRIVLGLVSSKQPELESKDELKRRVDEAAKYVRMEDLCLSPQCGFASTHHGNRITPDIQRRKLALIVETATEIWGAL